MTDEPFDFGAAVGRIAKLTMEASLYADVAATAPRLGERELLLNAQLRTSTRLAAAMAEFNERLQAMAPGQSKTVQSEQ